jgi:shikimate kinase
MNIVLIGYRGSGKSSIGRKLASELWMEFVDTDELIVKLAGKTIREIFAQHGEEYFRNLEEQAVAEASTRDNTVIAAGGGVVLRAGNVMTLKKAGKIIWLQADPKTLFERITADTATRQTRPDLTATGGLEEVKTVLAQRTPLYQAAADATLDVSRLSVPEAVFHLTRMV